MNWQTRADGLACRSLSGMVQPAPAAGRSGRAGARLRLLKWLSASVPILLVVVVLARLLVDEPLNEQLRRYLEQRVNAALQGYTVSIGKVDLSPIGFAVDLQEITVVQNARPRPPVAYVPRWTTSVDWRALFSLAVVADTTFDRPEVFLTEDQAVEEAKDPVPVSDRGWQDAVTAVYPLKVNTLRVRGGIVTYLQRGDAPPIRLDRVDFRATNIRNVESVAGQHPSPIELDCTVFKNGLLSARGSADFFAKPRPTMIADFTLKDMTLVPLASMARPSGILIDGGTLAVAGQLAQEPAATRLALRSAVVSKPVLEYARRPETKDREDVQAAKDATQSISVRIDELRVRDGMLTYQNPSELMPPIRFERTNLRLTSLEMPPPRASRPPSRVELDTALLGTGSLRVRGRADLGATSGPLGDLAFDLQGIELERFDQLARPWGLTVAGGTLSASGQLTRDPAQTRLVIRQLGVAKPVVEYVQVTPSDEQRVEQATKETTEARERPAVRVDLDRAEITGGTFGFTDKKATYPYRLFLADTDVTLAGFSNERSQRDGIANIRGRFMDSGPATLDARFEGGDAGQPEFALGVRVENVQLYTMNDLLRDTGGFDVASGEFSVYSDFTVRNGRIDGYVKPFFTDMDVYDRKQDAGKGVGQQLYEALVGAAATVLENRFHGEVATRAELSGPVAHPQASTWQIVAGLLRNAFWQAMVPGVDRQERPP
jgi:uncharacterized protein DUF748